MVEPETQRTECVSPELGWELKTEHYFVTETGRGERWGERKSVLTARRRERFDVQV